MPTREESTARGAKSPAKPACTCHCQVHNCPSGHTGHDAELHGPANEEESTARGALLSAIPDLYMPLQLSFWSIPAKMPILACDNQEEHRRIIISTTSLGRKLPLSTRARQASTTWNVQQLGNLCGQQNSVDREDLSLRHERNVDDFRRTATAGQPQFSAPSNEAPVEVPQRARQEPCPRTAQGV